MDNADDEVSPPGETETVYCWRRRFFYKLGFDFELARQLAASEADPHEVESLLAHGCSHEQAARIAS